MEDKFFNMYQRQGALALEVGHNSVADWCITIYDKKGKRLGDYGDPIVQAQGCDRICAFADAYIQLTKYLGDTRGGY